MKYSFHPYHKYFDERAQSEISQLKQIIPDAKIEHFGSTAIPGVGGKGIIDIYVAVPKDVLKQTSTIIQKVGYEFKLSAGIPDVRLFHQKTVKYPKGQKQTFHVHLTFLGSEDWVKSLAFRDYLRNNPKLAQEYSKIKHQAVDAAKKFRKKQDKKEAYMNAKRPVIEKIMRLVRA